MPWVVGSTGEGVPGGRSKLGLGGGDGGKAGGVWSPSPEPLKGPLPLPSEGDQLGLLLLAEGSP